MQPLAPLALVGAGAVGTALARRCVAARLEIASVSSRTPSSAQRLADAVGARVVPVEEIDAPVTLVCVPDDAVPQVARTLAAAGRLGPECLVAHTSGVLPASALAPLSAQRLSLHPPRSLPLGSDGRALDGTTLVLEGDDDAVEWGTELATAWGLATLRIDASAKSRYHLALSVASNFTVTLAALATEILGSAGVAMPDALALIRPLVSGTADNLTRTIPERALTGPVVRGDVETLARHLGALDAHLPHLLPVYTALATETVRVAVRSGRLSPPAADTLLDLLAEALREEA